MGSFTVGSFTVVPPNIFQVFCFAFYGDHMIKWEGGGKINKEPALQVILQYQSRNGDLFNFPTTCWRLVNKCESLQIMGPLLRYLVIIMISVFRSSHIKPKSFEITLKSAIMSQMHAIDLEIATFVGKTVPQKPRISIWKTKRSFPQKMHFPQRKGQQDTTVSVSIYKNATHGTFRV